MVRPSQLEVQEANGRNRAWSIGSELLGHYETEAQGRQVRIPPPNYHVSYSHSSAIIDIRGGTNPMTHGRVLGEPVDKQRYGIPPLARASTSFYDRVLTDWWWWELFSWLVSFFSVAAIVGVLVYYEGRKQPEYLVLGITINAYIAVFAAVAKAALILPVSEAIGQMKWMWFRRQSKLWDFFTFDSASRGPWGSLMLLGTTKCRHLVSLGAAIMILALAFEPFFQQIISYPTRDVVVGNSSVFVSTVYAGAEIKDITPSGSTNYYAPVSAMSMSLAIDSAIFTGNGDVRPPPSICPSGRCNWTTYSSLGVCHKCQDVSNLLEYTCQNHTVMEYVGGTVSARNPCGYQLNGTFLVGVSGYKQGRTLSLSTFVANSQKNRSALDIYWNSTLYGNITNSIIDFYVAYTPGGPSEVQKNSTPVLLECLMSWCVKSLRSSHFGGFLREDILETSVIRTNSQLSNIQGVEGSPAFSIVTKERKTFTIGENTTEALRDKLQSTLPKLLLDVNQDSAGQFPGIWNFIQRPPYDINPYLENLTTAMTNNMRSIVNGTETIVGAAWGSEKYVTIRWEWITLPAALLIGSFVFVCTTIVRSRKQNAAAWKSSALATLLHGLTEEARGQFEPNASPSEIEALSRKLHVRLSSERGNSRLVLV
ncbi:hypothetical protein K469DRAFT_733964 [Zopfia rhizophila CBS 207.26]|uniref:Uncharacterized protein n=1 Tax=Zopfia rhizophila CBS 207.26 TaxID=1314779 RepID=A0A6A6EVS2_9PEZI|nr:hypothetical protein K469DRAFT_733964 [Zopfia rhizophila CBS 207.26]